MATEAVPVTTYGSQDIPLELGQGKLDLQDLVKDSTWRDILFQLRDSGQLNPFDIDISSAIEAYLGIVRDMKVMDLHVPANIILAAAILLRFKSETLTIFEIEDLTDPVTEEIASVARVIPEVPALTPKIRMQPGKRITLMELMQALDDAMDLKEKKQALLEMVEHPFILSIPKVDINEMMDSVLGVVSARVDSEGLTTFSELAKGMTEREKVVTELFIPLLFLAHKEKVVMVQERFFDEIFIRIVSG